MSVVPSAATLVIKALKEPECERKKTKNIKHNGNISLDDVVETTKVMRPRPMWPKTSVGPSRRFSACASLWVEWLMGKTLRICGRRSLMVMWKSLWTK